MRFLVVDRAVNTVSALRSLLEGDGHEVVSFTSGLDAIEALAHGVFDAVLTELHPTGVPGDAVVRAARQHHPRACVFCCTARRAWVVPEGACHVFSKPVDYRRFVHAVTECQAKGGPRQCCRRTKQ